MAFGLELENLVGSKNWIFFNMKIVVVLVFCCFTNGFFQRWKTVSFVLRKCIFTVHPIGFCFNHFTFDVFCVNLSLSMTPVKRKKRNFLNIFQTQNEYLSKMMTSK